MNIICQRNLEFKDSSGAKKDLTIQFYQPVVDEKEGGDWECTFSITGEGIEITKTMYGIDSLQALTHAMMAGEAWLTNLKKTQKLHITWLGMKNLGFEINNLTREIES